MNITAARKYVSPRTRALTPEEQETRRISYALKDPTADGFAADLLTAAREMALLVITPAVLVPVPDSKGSTAANLKLAQAIARQAPNVKVIDVLTRTAPVESSCERHRRHAGPLEIGQHRITRKPAKWISIREGVRLYFVDNTATSGNTLAACRAAIGAGEGLVFSDAGPPPKRR